MRSVLLAVLWLAACVVAADAQTIEVSFGPIFARAESLGRFDLAFGTEPDASGTESTFQMSFPLNIERAWGVAPTVTLHTEGRLSHEVSYGYSQADLVFDFSRVDYILFLGDTPALTGSTSTGDPFIERLVVRDLGYGLIVNVRAREARVQPYVAVGPRLVAYRFKHGAHTNTRFFRRMGLGTVGSIVGGIRAAKTSPLEGGTIYRWGAGYGGGVRVRLTPTMGVKLDLRQTWIDNPDFAKGAEDLLPGAPSTITQDEKAIRRFHITLGATFTF